MPDFLKIMQGLGSPISGVFNIASNLIQNRQNMKMAEYAYQKELEQWNRQNEYNKPINQMARFKEAGLNPNLMYGQGTPGNATDSPNYSAPHLQYDNPFPNIGDDIGQLRQTNADVDLKKANEDLAKSNKDNVDQDTANKKLDNIIKALDVVNKKIKNARDKEELDYYQQVKDTLVKQEEELLRKIGAEADIAEENLNLVRSNVTLTNEQINLVKKQAEEATQRIVESKSRVRLNDAQRQLYNQQTVYYGQMVTRAITLLPYEEQQHIADILNTRADTSVKWAQKKLSEKNIDLTEKQISKLAIDLVRSQADLDIEIWKQSLREVGLDPDNHSLINSLAMTLQLNVLPSLFRVVGFEDEYWEGSGINKVDVSDKYK